MIWLAAHMWFLLITSFVIGIGIGWWVWGARTDKATLINNDTAIGTLESDAGSDGGDL